MLSGIVFCLRVIVLRRMFQLIGWIIFVTVVAHACSQSLFGKANLRGAAEVDRGRSGAVRSAASGKLPASGLYARARRRLISMGYTPLASTASNEERGVDMLPILLDMPEIDGCTSMGRSMCNAFWRAPDGRVLEVSTTGEPAPGKVDALTWLSADQFAALQGR